MKRDSRTITRLAAAAAVAVLLASPAAAYYQYLHYASRTGPFSNPLYEKFNLAALTNNTVTFFVSDQGPSMYGPNDSFGAVLSQIRQAAAAWNSVATSDLRVAFGGLESYSPNPTLTAPGGPTPPPTTPGGDVIFLDVPGLLGAGAPTTSTVAVTGANGQQFFPILRGVVMLSRDTSVKPGPSYMEAFFTTAVHEMGHALGLQHTWTGSAMSQSVIRNTTRTQPLQADDVAALSVLYGKNNWTSGFGSITGRVTYSTSGQPAVLASVVAISPAGPAVSALTNPDGTYRIDGLPTGSYMVYVHPLPPDAILVSGEGLRLPVDQLNQPFQPTGPFQTVFSTSTITVPAGGGSMAGGVDFSVQPRTSVTTYDVEAWCRLNTATRTYVSTGDTDVTPAFINPAQSLSLVTARASSPAVLPAPQSVTMLGGVAPAVLNASAAPAVVPFPDGSAMAIYFVMPLGVGTGQRHLVFNFGNDTYVLPGAVDLVQKGPPAIYSVTPNPDGTVTLTGAGFGTDSQVYFDGSKANITGQFTGTDASGSITVMPPPGASGQVATLSVYNSDGQNTMILQSQNPPTFTYPAAGPAQINTVSQPALPAGSTAEIDIAASNTNFVDGQVTLGFGSNDVTVRRVWVKDATHLVANVAVAAGAALGSWEMSVVSGSQAISQQAAFQTQPARTGLPVIGLPVANADLSQSTIYPGSYVSIYGLNLALSPAVQVTLNDQPMPIQPGSAGPTQVNFQIPPNFPTGVFTLKLSNGVASAYPVAVEVDAAPPVVVGVTNQSGATLGTTPANKGDLVYVLVTGLDPGVLTNPSRLQVMVNGVAMTVAAAINPLAGGMYQIPVILTQSFNGFTVPLTVVVDGSSGQAFPITVR